MNRLVWQSSAWHLNQRAALAAPLCCASPGLARGTSSQAPPACPWLPGRLPRFEASEQVLAGPVQAGLVQRLMKRPGPMHRTLQDRPGACCALLTALLSHSTDGCEYMHTERTACTTRREIKTAQNVAGGHCPLTDSKDSVMVAEQGSHAEKKLTSAEKLETSCERQLIYRLPYSVQSVAVKRECNRRGRKSS